MNQKDEIKKFEDKLRDLELQLDTQQYIFDTKYSDVRNQIQKLNARKHILYELKEKIKQDVAEVISDNVRRFIDGDSHCLKKEVFRGVDVEHENYEYRNMVRNIIWQKYYAFLDNAPQFQSIEEDINSLNKEEESLIDTTSGYRETEQKIYELTNEIKSTKSFIKELSDIGKFRQHAKRVKEREESDKQRQLYEESKKTYTEWFDANYTQKMKNALLSSLKKLEGE